MSAECTRAARTSSLSTLNACSPCAARTPLTEATNDDSVELSLLSGCADARRLSMSIPATARSTGMANGAAQWAAPIRGWLRSCLNTTPQSEAGHDRGERREEPQGEHEPRERQHAARGDLLEPLADRRPLRLRRRHADDAL